jgi:hypothetical protein
MTQIVQLLQIGIKSQQRYVTGSKYERNKLIYENSLQNGR